MQVLIVDDEDLARDTIRLLLKERDDIDIVGECKNGEEAVEAIASLKPDLVFLDIQMPGMNGFEVVEAVGPERMPVVIFATAYDQYALKAFEAHALDYLLKPFDDERFEKTLNRAIEYVEEKQIGRLSRQLLGLVRDQQQAGSKPSQSRPKPASIDRFMIKTRDVVYFVKAEDIEWVEAAGDYVKLHAGRKAHLLRETMGGMEEKLDPKIFVRIHRSTIVNVEAVRELKPYFHGDYMVYLKDGTELRLSRRYWNRLERLLGELG